MVLWYYGTASVHLAISNCILPISRCLKKASCLTYLKHHVPLDSNWWGVSIHDNFSKNIHWIFLIGSWGGPIVVSEWWVGVEHYLFGYPTKELTSSIGNIGNPIGTFKIAHKGSHTMGWTTNPFILQTFNFHPPKFHMFEVYFGLLE